MSPNHHPHPETLISYASGALSSAISCVVACHLSMCAECANEVRWLERLGGWLLSNLQTVDAEPAPSDHIVVQWPVPRHTCEYGIKPAAKVDDALLPLPLARYLGITGAKTSWKLLGNGIQERSIELSKGSGSIKLLRVSPGQPLPEHDFLSETEVALVLQGVCQDGAGIYVRGDVIEWAEDLPRAPTASGEAECVCLIADRVANASSPYMIT